MTIELLSTMKGSIRLSIMVILPEDSGFPNLSMFFHSPDIFYLQSAPPGY